MWTLENAKTELNNFLGPNLRQLLVVKLKVFKRDDNRDIRLVQKLTVGEANFNQLKQLTNRLAIVAENFRRVENLSSVLIPTRSKDMVEQINLAHKLIDIVHRASRKLCVTLLQYLADRTESSYAKVWILQTRRRMRNFNELFMWNKGWKNLSI